MHFSTVLRAWIIHSAFRGFSVSSAATAARISGGDSSFHLSASVQLFCHNPFAVLPRLIYTETNLGCHETDERFATDFPAARKRKKKPNKNKQKKKKRRKLEAASPSGEWQAAHHLGARSQHSPNKGRRGERWGLGTHCFNPPVAPWAPGEDTAPG